MVDQGYTGYLGRTYVILLLSFSSHASIILGNMSKPASRRMEYGETQ